jgi:hypothetical protein
MIDNGLYVDKEVARHSSITTIVVPTGSAVQIAPSSAKRCRIQFISDGTNSVTIGQQNPLDGNRVFRLPTTYPRWIFDKEDVGSMLQGAWFAQANIANVNVAVIDTVEQ